MDTVKETYAKSTSRNSSTYAAIACFRYSGLLREEILRRVPELESFKPYILGVNRGDDENFSRGYRMAVRILSSKNSLIRKILEEYSGEVQKVQLRKSKFFKPQAVEVKSENIPESPGTAQMIGSFSRSLIKWARKGFRTVSQEDFESRINECRKCEYWNPTAMSGTGKCKLCGCSTQAKLRLATEKCPINKWGALVN